MPIRPSIALSIVKTSANPRAALLNAIRRVEFAATGPKPLGFFGRLGVGTDDLVSSGSERLQQLQISALDLLGRLPKGIPRNPSYVPGVRQRRNLPQRISIDLMENTIPLAVGGGLVGLGAGAAID